MANLNLKRYVDEPPICSIALPNTSQKDLSLVTSKMETFQACLNKLNQPLNTECLILEKLTYKQTGQFRREKLLSSFKMVTKCLRRYRQMGVNKYMAALLGIITDNSCKRVPSTPMVSHLLSQLSRSAHLLRAVIDACLCGYSFIQQKLSMGHFVPNMLLYSAVLARIWFTSRAVLKKTVDFYDYLREQGCKLSVWLCVHEEYRNTSIEHLYPTYDERREEDIKTFKSMVEKNKMPALTNTLYGFEDEDSFKVPTSTENKARNLREDDSDIKAIATGDDNDVTDTGLHLLEDLGEIVSRKQEEDGSEMESEGETGVSSSQMENYDIDMETEVNEDTGTSEITVVEPRCCGRIKLKDADADLKDFTRNVCTDVKVLKRVAKNLCKPGGCNMCIGKRTVHLSTKQCKKLLKEVMTQHQGLQDVHGTKAKKKQLQKSSIKLCNKINKMLTSSLNIPVTTKNNSTTQHKTEISDRIAHNLVLQDGSLSDIVSGEKKTLKIPSNNPQGHTGNINLIVIQCKSIKQFVSETLSKKNKRLNLIQSLKSESCQVAYSSKVYNLDDSSRKKVLISFKKVTHWLKENKNKNAAENVTFKGLFGDIVNSFKQIVN